MFTCRQVPFVKVSAKPTGACGPPHGGPYGPVGWPGTFIITFPGQAILFGLTRFLFGLTLEITRKTSMFCFKLEWPQKVRSTSARIPNCEVGLGSRPH